ncbi:hypothetical protein LEP1GSC088_0548 [Leptospira interrogans str. L1207]|nr:hypothetical protein LEP1GSC088_0548 [Leptospira interrogans str. L1207]
MSFWNQFKKYLMEHNFVSKRIKFEYQILILNSLFLRS